LIKNSQPLGKKISENCRGGFFWLTLYTVFRKKHSLTFSFISPWIICGFIQKLQWIYPRIDRYWQCKNQIFIAIDDVIMTSHLSG